MAKAGRPVGTGGVKLTDGHRAKIQNSSILNALIEHVLGKRDMSPTQVTAGLGLLKKCLPDLAQTAHTDPDGNALNLIVTIGGDA